MTKGAAGIGLVLIIALLGIGTGFGFLLLPRFLERSTLLIPEGHQFIVDNMEVILEGELEQYPLEPLCVDQGARVYGKDSPLAIFKVGNEYYQTTWIWRRHGDTDAAITIWGPGEDDLTYTIEAARFHGGYKITFLYMGEPKRIMQPLPYNPSEIHPGYTYFTVTLTNSTG